MHRGVREKKGFFTDGAVFVMGQSYKLLPQYLRTWQKKKLNKELNQDLS